MSEQNFSQFFDSEEANEEETDSLKWNILATASKSVLQTASCLLGIAATEELREVFLEN